ncbi:potassium channel family protein [uncultured Methanobrevibacter sp.]|uniref:potassium channel family protein n=1 Tax=uncultured Methanobrevibacter sp. TaxID=253161 RepID=UPI0026160851|nr:ion transporter [uncultured Methanobrevibacter sp.]
MGEHKKQLLYLTLIFLTVIDVLLMAYVLLHPSDLALRYSIFAFDLIVCVLLWIEFIYSYWHASDKKEYLKNNSMTILGMLPIDFIFFRALRIIKLIQLIKLFALARETEGKISKFLKQTYLDKIIFVMIIFVFSITVLIRIVDSNINDILTALWYTIVSMTSTGYGDIIPATNLGKLIGMIAMTGGILIFASITAVISSLYMSRISKDNHDELKSKIDELNSEIEKLNKKIDEL